MIELRKDRSLHRAVPRDFEYLTIDWSNDDEDRFGGLVHVVDRKGDSVNEFFCLDVVAGMMEEDPIKFRSKAPVDSATEDKVIRKFRNEWDRFDWTKYLDMTDQN